jgi:hypothetical protein
VQRKIKGIEVTEDAARGNVRNIKSTAITYLRGRLDGVALFVIAEIEKYKRLWSFV